MNQPGAGDLVAIVEDDAAIAEGLALNLKLLGYRSQVISDGEAARRRIDADRPDLVLLDISLPKRDGLWVLERLREDQNHVPVIVLSARQDEFDKVAALRLGADDYITKPFALAELLARVAAVLRRSRLGPRPPQASTGVKTGEGPTDAERVAGQLLRFGNVVLDLAARTVTRAGRLVELTRLEFDLLSFLCQNPGRVYSRDQLLRQVWSFQHSGQARTVDNFIAQLRAKLEANPDRPRHLVTVRGSGYRFVLE